VAAHHSSRPLLISRWTSRSTPRALRGGYVGIDERSFAEILSESVHFSRFLRYFDVRDLPDGTWESLLAADRSASFALLATLDAGRRTAALEALAERVRREEDVDRKEEWLRRLIGALLRLADDIDRWLGPHELLGSDGHGARQLLEHEIREVLAPRLRRLLAIVAAAEREGLFREMMTDRVHHFRSIWLIEAVEELERKFEAETWIAVVLDEIAEHVQAFLDGVAAIAAGSAAALEASLDEASHAPHVGLLMAFIRLFRHAQDELNALPGRVAAFYREKVLLEKPRAALPDRTYLAFRPVPKTPLPEIPAGLRFPAGGRDDGTPIEFAADSALTVTGARLAAIRVWQPIVADGVRQRLNAAAAPLQPDGRIGMNLFAAPALPPARLGLIVASPLLDLRSGVRTVTISLGGLDPVPDTGPAELARLLRQAFRLSYTNPAGWIDVPAVAAEVDGAQIAFRFAIASDGPALAPWTGPDAPADMPDRPAIRLILVQDPVGDLAPLALLGALRFAAIRVDVSVEGLGNLIVSNSAGPAAAAPGVAPFGPVPVQGSWLRIDHPAFAAAPLDRLDLGLSWLGLPPDPDGFTGYYRHYVIGLDRELSPYPLFTNDGFRVDLCVPVGGGKRFGNVPLFDPPEATPPIEREVAPPEPPPVEAPAGTAAEGGAAEAAAPAPPDDGAGDTQALRGTTWFRVDSGAPAAGGDLCPNGSILVTLTEPPYSFGASLYPANVAYASSVIAAGEGREMRRESLAARLWRGLLKLLKKLLALLLDALKAVIAPVTMLWKLLGGGARWLRDLIFIRTDHYSRPEGMDMVPEPPEAAIGGEIAPTAFFPNPPWEPLLAAIRVNYAAHASWQVEDAGSGVGPDQVELFHVLPLEAPIRLDNSARHTLLPALPERPSFDLRIADWPAGEPLSLLFLTGPRPGAGVPASRLSWQYRTDGPWRPLPAASIARDETRGLTGTGILTLPPLVTEKKSLSAMLARVPVANDTERPPAPDEGEAEDQEESGALWIRATADGPGFGFPPIARILADSVSATRVGIEVGEMVPPIPAGTISQAPGVRGIARTEQPIDSFGGAPAEQEGQLALRTSARLRHKERAILAWDHEHLMLERFPGIERARVLPACSPDRPGRPAPGHVTAIVVPARGGATPPDPLRPATPDELRREIAEWLGRRCSPFARIHVVDPVYDSVNVRVLAWFGAEKKGAAMLRDDLAALLSPWSDAGLDLPDEAGPRALQARILQFVRTRSYVAALQSVDTDIAEAPPPGEWRIPVAGSLEIGALDRPPATGC
jgi:hypothetical protein